MKRHWTPQEFNLVFAPNCESSTVANCIWKRGVQKRSLQLSGLGHGLSYGHEKQRLCCAWMQAEHVIGETQARVIHPEGSLGIEVRKNLLHANMSTQNVPK